MILKDEVYDMFITIMFKNSPVTEIIIAEDRKEVKINKLVPDSIRQPFSGNDCSFERVYDFLKSRCYEDGRADLKAILRKVDLSHNDPWEWNRITHGVTYEDFFWIRFDDEKLDWEDVRVR